MSLVAMSRMARGGKMGRGIFPFQKRKENFPLCSFPSDRKLQQESKQSVMVAWSKEVVTEGKGRNDRHWPGNESQNAHPHLEALLCPSTPLPLYLVCPAQDPGRRAGKGTQAHDLTLPPAGRVPHMQGTPSRGGGGQGAGRPTGVHLRFTGHSREPAGNLIPLLRVVVHSGTASSASPAWQKQWRNNFRPGRGEPTGVSPLTSVFLVMQRNILRSRN